MASSFTSPRKWAAIISFIARCLHFLIIILQVPLFRVPCTTTGKCSSPMELTCSQLTATEIVHPLLVKLLLYPGAIAKALIRNKPIPKFSKLLKLYNFTRSNKVPSAAADLYHLEIVAGSYLSVAGAILGLARPGRMSLFGALMILWGFAREFVIQTRFKNRNPPNPIYIFYPQMFLTVLCAFLSIRKDIRWLLRSFKAQNVAKPLQSGTKYS